MPTKSTGREVPNIHPEDWDEQAFRQRVEEMRDENWIPAGCDTLEIETRGTSDGEFSAEEVEDLINKALDGLVVPDELRHMLAANKEVDAVDSITGTYDCICCGARLNGFIGSFTYGIRHGEGYCDICNYPHRAIHHIYTDEDHEEQIGSLQIVLPHHPSQLTFKDEEES